MKFEDLEKLCTELDGVEAQTQQKRRQISDLEEKAKHMEQDLELKKMMAELRGEETPPVAHGLEELEQAKKELRNFNGEKEELTKQALKGMAELDLPATQLEMDPDGNITATLEKGPYEKSVKFIADKFDSTVPLTIDGVVLSSEKVVVTKVGDLKKGVQKLLVFKQNIHRMARVAMGEKDPEIEKVIDYMRKGTYTDFWEVAGSKQNVTFENLYRELGITESSEKKRVQNFFTNSQKVLGEAFPFINLAPGVWERTFFGSLVWRRYNTLYPASKESIEIPKTEKEPKGEVKTGKTESKTQPLNKYMETKELDKILYGNTGE